MTLSPPRVLSLAADDPAWNLALSSVGPRSLFAFDYDGTLTPVGSAALRPETKQELARLLGVAGARVAILSARDSEEVRGFFADLAPLAPGFVLGRHGADPNDPEHVANKAEALAALAKTEAFEHVLYVGDDASDELVYAYAHEVPFTGIRVGPLPSEGTRAQLWLPEQTAVDRLLEQLTQFLVEMAPALSVARP